MLSKNSTKIKKEVSGFVLIMAVSATLLLIQNSKGTIIFLDKERSMEILYTIFA
jgi:hypothetical protein